jgi:hypothetical protein
MFDHIVHLHHMQSLWINFGSVQLGETSNSVRDFGHTHADNVTGSKFGDFYCDDANGDDVDCVFGDNGLPIVNEGAVGAADHYHGSSINQGDWFHHGQWMQDDQVSSDDMVPGGTGMFGHWAVHVPWTDTTDMDNLHAADITDSSIAGALEVIAGNTPANNVRGGHTVHTASDYDNNDTDNHYYWGVNGHNGAGDLAGKHDASYYTGMTGAQMTDFETIGPVNLQG